MGKPQFYYVGLKALIQNENGEGLFLQVPEHIAGRISYDLPGGRIDDDEFDVDYMSILRREIIEEVGDEIVVEIDQTPIGIARRYMMCEEYGKVPVLLIMFKALYKGGNILLSDEHVGFNWFDISISDNDHLFNNGIQLLINAYRKEL